MPAYSFMLSLAFVAGALIAIAVCKKHNISSLKVFGLVVIIQVFSNLGSRLLFVINNYSQFEANPLKIFSPAPGGFDFTGGLVLGILAGALYIKWSGLPFWKVADCLVPSLAVGIFLTKLGCFGGGCCYGKETASFPAVQFPPGSLAAHKFGVEHWVHPTQLYEAFAGLILLAAALFLVRKLKGRPFDGRLFLIFLSLYLLARTVNESLRGDALHNYIFNLTQTQFLNILLIAFAAVVYWMQWRATVR